MQIYSGKISRPQKVVIYGTEGIGKTTFAANFPDPLFIDTEGSTIHLDVNRLAQPTSWQMLTSQVEWVRDNKPCQTLVIDTADWAEKLAIQKIIAQFKIDGLEGLGYGKGYVYLEEEFGRLLNLLSDVIDAGMHVVLTAHATIRKFDLPDAQGAFDRWEMKLQRKTSPMVKEWADILLFANYKTVVVKTSDNKNKAQGGKRVMYTTHTPAWDAKNRHDLPEELPLEFSAIANAIEFEEEKTAPVKREQTGYELPFDFAEEDDGKNVPGPIRSIKNKQLNDLLVTHNVTPEQVQEVVGQKGYLPADLDINDYPDDFVDQVLIAAWDQVHDAIKQNQERNK